MVLRWMTAKGRRFCYYFLHRSYYPMWVRAVGHFEGAPAAAPGHALERAVPVMIRNRDKNGEIREDEGVD